MTNTFYNDFDAEVFGDHPRREDYRTPFQVDRDRLIYTSAFRQLQNKTQVFFSGEYDFYRTRLTHSLEVAQIGRSICQYLRSTSDDLGEEFFIDADLVEAACLAHDLGHPPFGHAGERTLHQMMQPYGGFEGNAQTLRLLTATVYGDIGMAPSRAFVDGTLKYKTLFAETPDAPNHFIYDDQREVLEFIFDGEDFTAQLEAGKKRNAFRSIECKIMDWADDSAYSLNDILDGVKAGFLRAENVRQWAETESLAEDEAKWIDDLLNGISKGRLEAQLGRKIGDFIQAVRLVKEDSNLLAKKTNRHAFRLEIHEAAQRESALYKRLAFDVVFRSPQLQQLEFKSAHLLERLFRTFESIFVKKSERGLRILPESIEEKVKAAEAEGERARLICDHLASMTDRSATRIYRRLFDADFGSIVDLI
ncbi:MAG: dGTP triphosphohydrolase [Verrucomicrobiota bacterium]